MENKNNDKKVINCKFSQFFLEFVALLLVWNDSNSVFLRQLKRNNLKQIRNLLQKRRVRPKTLPQRQILQKELFN